MHVKTDSEGEASYSDVVLTALWSVIMIVKQHVLEPEQEKEDDISRYEFRSSLGDLQRSQVFRVLLSDTSAEFGFMQDVLAKSF